jgi:phosphatidylglycerol:prolipoprotein diacylglycerol transferase
MQPILFNIPGIDLPIYSYGLMLVIGFLVATELAKYLARRENLNADHFVNAALLALLAGVAGSRLSHVLENIGQYTDPSRSIWANFIDAVNIRSGGLTFYGGLLLATPVLIGYAVKKKIPLLAGMDIIAPCIMVGLAFGRVGCFLNGCCGGAACDLPWAVTFPEASHATHPAQLYSALNAAMLVVVLLAFYTLPHAPGRVFALMLMLLGVSRFMLEMLRSEPAVLGPMSFSMVISAFILIPAGVAFWYLCGYLENAGKLTPQLTGK